MVHDVNMTVCAAEGCDVSMKDHYWGRVKAEGWFFQRDGTAWCPEHVPEWVEEWRLYKEGKGK